MAEKVEDDDFSSAELQPHERKRVRRLLRDADYSKRFWGTVRLWLGWLSGSVIFTLTFWDKVKVYIPIKYLPWGP